MKHTVSEITLKNGAKGLFMHVPGATVTNYEFNFRAGEFLLDRKKTETSHLMEHVILGANEDYPNSSIFQAELNKNGASTNAYTSYYYVSYVGETADFEWERVLRLQLLAISKPLFLQAEFDAEFGNIRDEMTSLSNNHFRNLSGTMGQTFGFNQATDKERAKLMKNVTREDVVEHYKRTHFTRNLRFIIAGDLRGRRPALKKVLESIELPKGPARFEFPKEKANKPDKPTFIANQTVQNIYLILSTYYNDLIPQKDDDALGLARIMLTETLYSKIFGQARDKGLVYHVSSSHQQSSKNTEWWLSAQVLPENAPALCDIIISEVKKVQNGQIDDSDLEATKQYALGSFQRSLQTVGNVANAYARYFFDDHIEDMKTIPERIKSVGKKDMARAMSRMFEPGIGNVGVLGGKDSTIPQKLKEQLKPLWK
jgi:predicted Zn-dependent peptidase